MRKLLVAEFVIGCVTFSGIFIAVSYLVLLLIHAQKPPEMLNLAIPLLAGAFGAVAKARLKSSNTPAKSYFDYAVIAGATLEVYLSIHYVLLFLVKNEIPGDIPTAILSLATIILATTTFGKDSGTPEDTPKK